MGTLKAKLACASWFHGSAASAAARCRTGASRSMSTRAAAARAFLFAASRRSSTVVVHSIGRARIAASNAAYALKTSSTLPPSRVSAARCSRAGRTAVGFGPSVPTDLRADVEESATHGRLSTMVRGSSNMLDVQPRALNQLSPAERLFIKPEYSARSEAFYFHDSAADATVWQPEAYPFAAHLARRYGDRKSTCLNSSHIP